jgi:hypothetical protein
VGEADWVAWHEQYHDPDSPVAARLAVVQGFIRTVLEARSGLGTRVVSMCAGEGLDLLGVLPTHPARERVTARLVERDPRLAARAEATARAHGLAGVEVHVGDAALTDAYAGAVPADLVLVCGVFGNISDEDVRATVAALPALCAPGGAVIWTRHRREPDLTPAIRRWLAEAGFVELAFESQRRSFAVGLHRLGGRPRALVPGRRLFTFTR